MKKISQVFEIKTGCQKVLFSDAFKNEEINFLHYIFLPFIDGGWYLGAGYEVRLRISLLGDLKPLWNDLRFSFFNLKMTPKIQFKNVEDRLFKFYVFHR